MERRCVGVYVGCYTQSELRGFVVVKRSSTINGVLLGYCLKLGKQKVFGAGKKNVILKVGLSVYRSYVTYVSDSIQ